MTFREQESVSAFTLSRHIEQHFTNTHTRDGRDGEAQSGRGSRNTSNQRGS